MSRALRPLCWFLFLGGAVFFLGGCVTRTAGPGAPAAVRAQVPAQIISNLFFVETAQADGVTRRFLVDTGSSTTYASPELAQKLGVKEKGAPATVRIESVHGEVVTLPRAVLRQLRVGAATFDHVPVAVYDFAELSEHLGLKVDGLLGFPLFRDRLLTLDYAQSRLLLAPLSAGAAHPPRDRPGQSTFTFNNEQGVPFIPVQLGNESFVVLIDTGSDGALALNPAGLHPRFLHGPRPGTFVSSLAGDRQQEVGRLAQDLLVGTHVVSQPIVDLTGHVSTLGGELLRHFTLTFDQRRKLVTFARPTEGSVVLEPRRSMGLALARTPAYWRVIDVVPATPAQEAGVQAGELIVRINGEPVARWSYDRFAALLGTAAKVTFTFVAGTREVDRELPVFELVP